MPCVHLNQLFKLCRENDVRLSSSDLINVVCKQCGKQEVCPDTLIDQVESVATDQANDHPDPHHHEQSDA
ncbi:MAG: hypothetical protein R3C05_32190 [Pirellulaceae bacterium]